MEKNKYTDYSRLLRSELILARGCTEPIALAYAGAKAREVLGTMPEHCHVKCSGNIIKNVSGVIVPKSGGLRGVDVAVTLGIIGGTASFELDVLRSVTEEHAKQIEEKLQQNFCTCELAEGVENLYLQVEVSAGNMNALVEISRYHTNITRIEKNHEILFQKEDKEEQDIHSVKQKLCVEDILNYADSVNLEEIRSTLEQQIACNSEIAREGVQGNWGAQIGRTLLEKRPQELFSVRAAALAAAGSDARMNGCDLPVVINSGSGNQGITASLPVILYADELGASHDELLRALAVSNLIALHQKRFIGSLSAYCGATSAACGAACGIAYLQCNMKIKDGSMSISDRYNLVSAVITNTICTIGGMVCDGAKSSCAAKIASAVQTALLSVDMAFANRVFQSGEGLVMDTIEETIAVVGRMGREGMRSTDVEILNMMLRQK